MIFDPAEIVSFVSHVMPLEPGDIVSTGTPGAVHIDDGDTARCEVGDLIPLQNPVRRNPTSTCVSIGAHRNGVGSGPAVLWCSSPVPNPRPDRMEQCRTAPEAACCGVGRRRRTSVPRSAPTPTPGPRHRHGGRQRRAPHPLPLGSPLEPRLISQCCDIPERRRDFLGEETSPDAPAGINSPGSRLGRRSATS